MRYRLSFWFAVGLALLTASLSFVLTFAHLLALALDLAGIALLRSLCHWEVLGIRVSWSEFSARRR